MKVLSWNVNGIRAISKKGFYEWLEKEDFDVICLQETKAHPGQLDDSFINFAGYKSYWSSAAKKGYSGVAIYSKIEPEEVTFMGAEEFDSEGRVLVARYKDFTLINAYFPNSQEKGKRIDYKLAFCSEMLKLCNQERKDLRNLVLCGDLNIAHKPIDLKNPDQNEGNPGYLPEERKWMDLFIEKEGYVDAFRHLNGDLEQYTWWSYRTRARERNVGWRIDYHVINPEFTQALKKISILDQVLGSDHCPVLLELKL
jgi:exodeoxyribonuclease III